MKIEEKNIKDIPVLKLYGRFDSLTSEHLEERLTSVIEAGASNICLDCQEVEFISSSALRILLSGLKKVKRNQGTIVLAAMSDQIKEVFDLAGFLELFAVHNTCEEALMMLQ
jgi:anti-sigma B factor antagonist